MNHIAASAPPRQQTGVAILMGQDHRSLVSGHQNPQARGIDQFDPARAHAPDRTVLFEQ